MLNKKYNLQDIYDYLYQYYNIEWVGYQVLGREGGVRLRDYNTTLDNKVILRVAAAVYEGNKRKPVLLEVTDDYLVVSGYKEPEVKWKDFLANIHTTEQELSK